MISPHQSDLASALRGLSAPEQVYGLARCCEQLSRAEISGVIALVGAKLRVLDHLLDGHATTVEQWDAIQALAERFSDIVLAELSADDVARAWTAYQSSGTSI